MCGGNELKSTNKILMNKTFRFPMMQVKEPETVFGHLRDFYDPTALKDKSVSTFQRQRLGVLWQTS